MVVEWTPWGRGRGDGGERSGARRLIQLLRRLISIDVIVDCDAAASLAVDRWSRPVPAGLVLLPAPVSRCRRHARSNVLTLINVKRNLVACIWIRQAHVCWPHEASLPVPTVDKFTANRFSAAYRAHANGIWRYERTALLMFYDWDINICMVNDGQNYLSL